jgi:hypothetical protein
MGKHLDSSDLKVWKDTIKIKLKQKDYEDIKMTEEDQNCEIWGFQVEVFWILMPSSVVLGKQ